MITTLRLTAIRDEIARGGEFEITVGELVDLIDELIDRRLAVTRPLDARAALDLLAAMPDGASEGIERWERIFEKGATPPSTASVDEPEAEAKEETCRS